MELASRLQLCLVMVAIVLAASSGISAAPAAKPPPKPLALSGYPTRAAAAAAARQLAGLASGRELHAIPIFCRLTSNSSLQAAPMPAVLHSHLVVPLNVTLRRVRLESVTFTPSGAGSTRSSL